MTPLNIQGSIVALVTPVQSNGTLDEKRLRELVRWHIESGTNAIVPCGTTGESATLSHEEHHQVIDIVVDEVRKHNEMEPRISKEAQTQSHEEENPETNNYENRRNHRVSVIAGAGSNSTREAISLTEHAKNAGADAVLSISPYYNKPTQQGLIAHYQALNEVSIPIIVYNVPGRTGSNITAETTLKLAQMEYIAGIKEASGNMSQIMQILNERPEGFRVYSGDDSLAFPLMMLGADGCISVVANEIPKEFSTMLRLCLEARNEKSSEHRIEEAREIHFRYLKLMEYNFLETNPIPVKTALGLMGKIEANFRLPLVPMSESAKEKFTQVLREVELIS